MRKKLTLDEYWIGVEIYQRRYPHQRYAQAAFNYLYDVRMDLSENIRGDRNLDPFYLTDEQTQGHSPHNTWNAFKAFLKRNWN